MSHSDEFLARLQHIKGKRARVVIDHILEHGFITTEDLEKTYGYKHPPRALRDVREQGIVLETFRVKDTQGRTIAAYRFGENIGESMGSETLAQPGRRPFTKAFRQQLMNLYNFRCNVCG
ncbi:MAG: hypothetical protein SF029_05255 [bacterium]|nr:hypothetical protein [bacterium]